jgi:Fe-S cluster assembly ATP-binding protein
MSTSATSSPILLHVENLHARVVETGMEILKGITLTIRAGEIHAIMGPNGSGKSTLAKVIAGDPNYEITSGRVLLNGKDLIELDPTERAQAGFFLSFQHPVEVPGVTNASFLRLIANTQRKAQGLEEMDPLEFDEWIQEKLQLIEMRPDYLKRAVNDGFSGGEKKRNEILQMAVLNPQVAFLDEIDSGLDIDALRIVAKGVNQLVSPTNAMVLVTHYQRLLNYIQPDVVHVLAHGHLLRSGGKELALELETKGYDWLLEASGVQPLMASQA